MRTILEIEKELIGLGYVSYTRKEFNPTLHMFSHNDYGIWFIKTRDEYWKLSFIRDQGFKYNDGSKWCMVEEGLSLESIILLYGKA